MEITNQKQLREFSLYFLKKQGVLISRYDRRKMKKIAKAILTLHKDTLKSKYKNTGYYNGVLRNFVLNKGRLLYPVYSYYFTRDAKQVVLKAKKKRGKEPKRKTKNRNYDDHLQSFWATIERLSKEDKMAKVVELSQEKVKRKSGKYENLRKKKNKLPEGSKCIVCGGHPNCMHHLIQLQYGGNNRKTNLVPICNDCHARVHSWLMEKHIEINESKSLNEAWERFE